ncbi:Hypothetical protein, putative [Bodo saltans]|uniref:Uncharacterized protein n=1 Tax=Bodo saltans TaxID=75058 RepID=A0A0S4ILY3_BODSA|nr:Hypothetical protein, putative [Bodo saltans]|eukprot:CUE72121.1 Hypothetical protein, putative [Bodo saltans]
MGDKPRATYACCAVDPREIRDALGWSNEHVEVRVFAAGTGIWAAKNHSGSENHRFRLSILRAPRESDLYCSQAQQCPSRMLRASGIKRRADHAITVFCCESDYACTKALENPRVAACIVAQCQKLAKTTLVGQVARGMSGYNVRREVLQPVAEKFRSLSGLSDTSGEEACRLLVESFRKEEILGSEEQASVELNAV